MTVEELIFALEKLPIDAEVRILEDGDNPFQCRTKEIVDVSYAVDDDDYMNSMVVIVA